MIIIFISFQFEFFVFIIIIVLFLYDYYYYCCESWMNMCTYQSQIFTQNDKLREFNINTRFKRFSGGKHNSADCYIQLIRKSNNWKEQEDE